MDIQNLSLVPVLLYDYYVNFLTCISGLYLSTGMKINVYTVANNYSNSFKKGDYGGGALAMKGAGKVDGYYYSVKTWAGP